MLQVDRFPKPGETLSAQSMTTSAGGKVLQVQLVISMCMTPAKQQNLTRRGPIKLQLQLAWDILHTFWGR